MQLHSEPANVDGKTAYSGLKATFDGAAREYAAVRPAYPGELTQAVIALSGLPEGGRILEIGCGTGQATAPFAARGYRLLCLEPGKNLAAVAAERFRDFPNVSVEVVTFEDWPMQKRAFDLVLSAQAFHWIDPEVGCQKAAEALKPTGSLALIWNLTPETAGHEERTSELFEISEAMQRPYALHAPELMHKRRENPLEPQIASLEERLRSQADLFRDMTVLRVPWTERYDARRYVKLLSTYSGHIALPEERRQRLFDGIAEVIEEHGGLLVKPYLSVLFLTQAR